MVVGWIETRCLGGLYWKDQSPQPLPAPATWRLLVGGGGGCPTPWEAGLKEAREGGGRSLLGMQLLPQFLRDLGRRVGAGPRNIRSQLG